MGKRTVFLLTVTWIIVLAVFVTITTSRICPNKFHHVGRSCYYFSRDKFTWQDAHFQCLNLNSSLAIIPAAREDFLLRKYLHRNAKVLGRYERWIGARFDWKRSLWVWGATGDPVSFSKADARNSERWQWHCCILDPANKYRWSARSCITRRKYVCQTPANSSNTLTTAPKENNSPGFLVKSKKKPRTKKGSDHRFTIFDYSCNTHPHMILLGRKCYSFSTEVANWNDAYWACRQNKSKLAIVKNKLQDDILRGFLNKNVVENRERWIGALYDWKQGVWKWAMNGRVVTYTNFYDRFCWSNATFNAITLDPRVEHRWNSRGRFEQKYYICQANAKSVGKANNK